MGRAVQQNGGEEKMAGGINKKNVVLLVVALLLGVGGTVGAKTFIEATLEAEKKKLAPKEEQAPTMVNLVVPSSDLPAGIVIDVNMISARPVPVDWAPADAVTPDNYEAILGQRLKIDVPAGKPILFSYIIGGLAPTLSEVIPEGKRALTLPVDNISSVSGFLMPGDNIDLIMNYTQNGVKYTRPLLENLKVLATDSFLETKQTELGATANNGRISTITVAVTAEDAKRLIFARDNGQITAVLRNPNDNEALADRYMTMSRLFSKQTKVPPRVKPKPQPKGVEFIIGGSE